jgi:hypothetical protein
VSVQILEQLREAARQLEDAQLYMFL